MKNKTTIGQSLFEVIFAIGIAALILTAIVSLAASSVRNSSYASNNVLATKYAQEALEWLRMERDTDWTVFDGNASGTKDLGNLDWGAASEDIGSTIFDRRVEFTSAGGTITATVIVEWDDAQGTHEVRSVTDFTNWRENTL